MRALSDSMLGGGCARLVESVHAESVKILTGADAGREDFVAVVENEPDAVMNGVIVRDPRKVKMVRFINGKVPRISEGDRISIADGTVWRATLSPGNNYLTTDFRFVEFI